MKKNYHFILTAVLVLLASIVPASADLQDSVLITGTMELIQDALRILTILCPIAAAAFTCYFFIRKSGAPPEEALTWQKRIQTAILCGVAGTLSVGIISTIAGYYGSRI